jgi:cytochrome P450
MLRHARAPGATGQHRHLACPPRLSRQALVPVALARRRLLLPLAPAAAADGREAASSSSSSSSPAVVATLPPPPPSPPPADLASLPLPPRARDAATPIVDSKSPSLLERAAAPLNLSDMVAFMQRPASFLGDRRKALGPVFAADNILFKPTVFLYDEADVRKALGAEHRLVEQRWPAAFAALLGSSFQGGRARHAFHRRAMGAAFTAEAIAAYQPYLQRLIERRLESARLDAAAGGGGGGGGGDGTFPAWRVNHAVAFDVAASLLLGFEDIGEESTRELNELFRTFIGGFVLSPPIDVPFTRYGKAMAARRRIIELLSGHLTPVMARMAAEEAEREAARAAAAAAEAAGRQGADLPPPPPLSGATTALRAFLTARDDDGRRVTLEEAKEGVLFLAFAGSETTGTSISQALRLLDAHRPSWRALVEEQRRVVARHGPELTAAAAADMPYADAVVRETLRLCPVVRFVWREVVEEFAVGGGGGGGDGGDGGDRSSSTRVRIPAGTQVVCSLAAPIEDIPVFAPDREAFRPERWLEAAPASASAGADPLAAPWRLTPAPSGFLPFGAGGRVCLGVSLAVAEMRAYLAVVARRYEFEVLWPAGSEGWDGRPTEAGFVVPGDMPVRLTPRREEEEE